MIIKIEEYKPGNEESIIELIRSVYDEFIAPDYTEAGNYFFYEYINAENIRKRHGEKTDYTLLAKEGEYMAGILTIKNCTHVSLLFVHKDFQRKGISKLLFETYFKKVPGITEITVNASPYSEKIYERLGFVPVTSEMQEAHGIKYKPMIKRLKENP